LFFDFQKVINSSDIIYSRKDRYSVAVILDFIQSFDIKIKKILNKDAANQFQVLSLFGQLFCFIKQLLVFFIN